MEYKKLDNIFLEIRNGANIKQSSNKTGKPITRIETIVHNKIDLTRVGYADIFSDKYEDFYLKNGDILMSHINSVTHLGKVAVVENIDTDIIHGMNLLVLKSDKSKVFPKYSYYYFLTNKFRKQLIPITKKSVNQASFNISDLKEIQIPLPSYENQLRIVKLLEKIEATISERKNGIDLLDELVKATFYQMFGDPVRNEKGWRKDEVGKYADSMVPGRDKPKSFTGDIPWVTTDKLTNLGHLDKNRISLFLSLDEIQQAKSKIIPSGSILMTCVGDLGIVSVTDFPSVANQQLHSYQCKTELNNVFTMYCLSLSKSHMYRMASTTTVPYMNKTVCNTIPIILPPIALQNQFADIAQKIETIKSEQEAHLKGFEELYNSVSQKVFEGDIDLSKVPFDDSLLPNPIEVPTNKEPIDKFDVFEKKEVSKKGVEKVRSKNNIKGLEFGFEALRHLESWEQYSFKEIADSIIKYFSRHYFNSEMILNFLDKELDIQVNYYSSAEQKKNPQYENADDFYRFISTALTRENYFLQLEQVFYNAETENIPDISFTEKDLESLSKKDKKERSGIYFHVKDETTTP
ncbi:restriction endonuclease subunit S [Pedobacter alluvionis]|uniref:Restriction endonuclease S subunit n=1 Tax=Pedobacter alluvionis TaxID=475253 RepID=A0A497XWU4_9SPHI|nr:restriction endonuclease subunit S [Pedobacter alluvionis]RLJ74662.1 restriction endonuclease S subunit [Pedobacter alluvionis]TFB29807.1 restriction endonuclease subunit S [Pedobacter alluvionis]